MINELNERLLRNNIDPVMHMEELNEVLKSESPRKIIDMTKRNFDYNHPYFEFDGYGNLRSYSTIEEVLDLYSDIE